MALTNCEGDYSGVSEKVYTIKYRPHPKKDEFIRKFLDRSNFKGKACNL